MFKVIHEISKVVLLQVKQREFRFGQFVLCQNPVFPFSSTGEQPVVDPKDEAGSLADSVCITKAFDMHNLPSHTASRKTWQ